MCVWCGVGTADLPTTTACECMRPASKQRCRCLCLCLMFVTSSMLHAGRQTEQSEPTEQHTPLCFAVVSKQLVDDLGVNFLAASKILINCATCLFALPVWEVPHLSCHLFAPHSAQRTQHVHQRSQGIAYFHTPPATATARKIERHQTKRRTPFFRNASTSRRA